MLCIAARCHRLAPYTAVNNALDRPCRIPLPPFNPRHPGLGNARPAAQRPAGAGVQRNTGMHAVWLGGCAATRATAQVHAAQVLSCCGLCLLACDGRASPLWPSSSSARQAGSGHGAVQPSRGDADCALTESAASKPAPPRNRSAPTVSQRCCETCRWRVACGLRDARVRLVTSSAREAAASAPGGGSTLAYPSDQLHQPPLLRRRRRWRLEARGLLLLLLHVHGSCCCSSWSEIRFC